MVLAGFAPCASAAWDVDVCVEAFVDVAAFFADAGEDFEEDVARVVAVFFPVAVPADVADADVFVPAAFERDVFVLEEVDPVLFAAVDVVPADFAGVFFAGAVFVADCFCAALRVVVDRRLACALRIDSAGSDDFVSTASAASCCATSSERSPRGKKTSEGRPVSWLGISDPRPRPSPRRFSAIPDSSQ